MATVKKSENKILSREYITKTDVMMLFGVGDKKARGIFNAVRERVETEGKINIPGRIPWRKMYKMLGLPIPQIEKNIIDYRTKEMKTS